MKFSKLALAFAFGAALASGAQAADDDGKYSVFLITMDQIDQHWVRMNDGAQKAANELGNIDLTWMAPDIKDDSKQIEVVNNAVAGGADVIMIAANGPTAISSSLKEANAAGVKIIYVDSPADFPALKTLATNNMAAGETAGKTLLKHLNDKGITEGRIGIIGVNAATNSTVSREMGFRTAFANTNFELLETQYCDGDTAKAKDIAANYYNLGCIAVFGTNEGSTVGAGNAVRESGGEMVGIGFDKSDMVLSLVKNGQLIAVMAQNPDVMGYEGVKTAEKAMKGEDLGEEYVDTGVSIITKENVEQFR